MRELRDVGLRIHRHFSAYASDPRVKSILLHDDNQAVIHVLNSMVSASKPMMVVIRRLDVILRVQGVWVEVQWIPSAVKRFAESLSRTWEPGDVRATQYLLD